MTSSLFLGSLLALISPIELAAQVKPSANRGKSGTYTVDTDVATYKYFVCVPKSYSEDRPAGIHVYFHGQNGQAGASNFGNWSKHFLEPFNLIGINMQYNDGDNYKDTDNKVRVAMQAVLQVMADYKVMPRGAVASFSGGGQTLGEYFTNYGKTSPRPPVWPFTHCAIYGSNFRVNAAGAVPMSWFIGLGGKEWNMFTIGSSQTKRMAELLADTAGGGSPDVYLRIEPDKAHSVSDADVAASARIFARSDLVFGPVVYAPDYAGVEFQLIVRSANELALGKAAKSVDVLLKKTNLTPEVKAKGSKLKEHIDNRIAGELELCTKLAKEDPVLFAYYGGIVSRQLTPHPRAKELRDLMAAAKKDKALAATGVQWTNFVKAFPGLFADNGTLQPGASTFLDEVAAAVPSQSLLGTMAREFLKMK